MSFSSLLNRRSRSIYTKELEAILDLVKLNNRRVWPIFYKVEPSDVRHQRKSYADAMTRHEIKFGKDSQKLKT